MDNTEPIFSSGNLSWSISKIWYESLMSGQNERKVEPRAKLWASELGKSPLELFLKLKGVAPSNPYDPRSRMKFEAGNIWEGVVGMVLKRAGVLKSSQDWVKYEYPGLLPVTGKLDFLAGGVIDWDESKRKVADLKNDLGDLPGFSNALKVAETIVNKFSEMYPNGLKEVVFEVKSSSSFQFDRRISLGGVADPEHKLQSFHYLKATNRSEAHVFYVCKDDSRMLEVGVLNPSHVEDEYKKAIKTISDYYKSNIQPEKDKELDFDTESLTFKASWKVKYSPYLTLLYGYKDQNEFDAKYEKKVRQWNSTYKRIVLGKNMTALNKSVIEDIKKEFADFDNFVQLGLKDTIKILASEETSEEE